MTSWLLHILHVVVLLESSWSKVLTEDVARLSGVEERVFAHGSARQDMVSMSMFKVYEKYSKEPQKDANTVRSFKAEPSVIQGKEVFKFNVSSIQESEVVLSASLHFLYKRPRNNQRPWRFRRPRHPSGSLHQPGAPVPLLSFYGLLAKSDTMSPLGNITLSPIKKGSWQSLDITTLLREARDFKDGVIMVEMDVGTESARAQHKGPTEELSTANLPFMMLYLDDQAIDEPNSVALSLQRYGPFPAGEETPASAARTRRELHHQIQTNDIPEVQFNTLKNQELWQSTYFPAKPKQAVKGEKKQGQESRENLDKPQVLSFDERTMKKARRRQWSEPRVCSRRYLKVDFADIGWSEWVLAPKSFDAYYCAGTCGFPIPKVVRPSNHATIQSIVRAVGIIPGVPEPCCVPEKMSPLSVLFLDTSRNMVLKVYPGMSVDTCACR
ncbi:growth/differentiation factor 10b [Synchiropus splendidus]|uniref:growth/differentiation factor 10b n=1 Tax=Synchiropus splendidus TaxID=270530 RepID=UPI00237E8BC9|nr:growth/differentiation factor 10b [Synchiropus splendidus]